MDACLYQDQIRSRVNAAAWPADGGWNGVYTQVGKTPCNGSRRSANLSRLWLRSRRNAWANLRLSGQPNLHRLGRPDALLAPGRVRADAGRAEREPHPVGGARRHYMTQPLVELYGGCMLVLKAS